MLSKLPYLSLKENSGISHGEVEFEDMWRNINGEGNYLG